MENSHISSKTHHSSRSLGRATRAHLKAFRHTKEQISQNEIDFLPFLLASEGPTLGELNWEFEKWGCEKSVVMVSLSKHIEKGGLLISKLNGKLFSDLSVNSSLELASDLWKLNTNKWCHDYK